MDRELLEGLTLGSSPDSRWHGFIPLVVAILTSFAVAGPTWRMQPSPFSDDPAPVMILLRVDDSMSLSDLSPSRLERAHLKITDFAEQRRGQPTGLAAYAGSPHLVLPPTRDTGVVATMAGNLSPEVMPKPGDDLVGALVLANRVLEETGGAIVVVADNVPPLSEVEVAEVAGAGKSPIHFLGVTRRDTPEWDAIRSAARTLRGEATLISADESDIESLVRQTARAPIRIESSGDGARWSEEGWWLIPVVALLYLSGFRRDEVLKPSEEVTA